MLKYLVLECLTIQRTQQIADTGTTWTMDPRHLFVFCDIAGQDGPTTPDKTQCLAGNTCSDDCLLSCAYAKTDLQVVFPF